MVNIDGKEIAQKIQDELAAKITKLQGRKPCLAVILVGNNPASEIYVRRKIEASRGVGMHSLKIELPATSTEDDIWAEIEKLNLDPEVDGILVQLPVPSHINPLKITQHIDPHKDVDGLHPVNMGKLLMGAKEGFVPCTPLGIQTMLEHYGIEVTGKHAVVIGRSTIVGKPMAALLLQSSQSGNATVTVLHSQSQNIKELCRLADIIIVAIGKPRFLTKDMVKPGAVVIDVGINKVEDKTKAQGYRLVGDADYEGLREVCSHITPVPGGVGPMTIAMLLSNTLKSYLARYPGSI